MRPATLTTRVATAAAVLLLSAAGEARADPLSLEYQVKAAYLAKFVPFVQWPAGAMAPRAPVNICVVGSDPFGRSLADIARQPIGDHPVRARRLARAQDGVGCQVLYVRGAPGQPVADALAAVRGAPVLTVTDAVDGDGARGILHFVVSQNRVRFQVDAVAAEENQLVISSKLQSLAVPSRGAE